MFLCVCVCVCLCVPCGLIVGGRLPLVLWCVGLWCSVAWGVMVLFLGLWCVVCGTVVCAVVVYWAVVSRAVVCGGVVARVVVGAGGVVVCAAWIPSVHLDAPSQRHGRQPVSWTTDPTIVKHDNSSRGSVDTTRESSDTFLTVLRWVHFDSVGLNFNYGVVFFRFNFKCGGP